MTDVEARLRAWYAAVAENIVTLAAAASVFIWASGGWKFYGIAFLLNLNSQSEVAEDRENASVDAGAK